MLYLNKEMKILTIGPEPMATNQRTLLALPLLTHASARRPIQTASKPPSACRALQTSRNEPFRFGA